MSINGINDKKAPLKLFSLSFKEESLEKKFNEKSQNSKLISNIFQTLNLLYSLINVVVLAAKTNQFQETINLVYIYISCVLGVVLFYLSTRVRETKLYLTILYMQFIMFSFNNFQFGNQLRILTGLNPSAEDGADKYSTKIIYFFLCADCMVKFLWITTSLNNFIYLLISKILNFIGIFIFLIINDFLKQESSGIFLLALTRQKYI